MCNLSGVLTLTNRESTVFTAAYVIFCGFTHLLYTVQYETSVYRFAPFRRLINRRLRGSISGTFDGVLPVALPWTGSPPSPNHPRKTSTRLICPKFGQLILRKMNKILATRSRI